MKREEIAAFYREQRASTFLRSLNTSVEELNRLRTLHAGSDIDDLPEARTLQSAIRSLQKLVKTFEAPAETTSINAK
ncbi:hypothetical protein [Granulicella sp. S156]|jgi:hypothetical protein|uniref:hypothetical protein n=1 Tax=Granulicella sp. S156 TaxID=1747224 RepID=UPI00131B0FD4|nr:hypothetical protein [Granulicella sp. S156]